MGRPVAPLALAAAVGTATLVLSGPLGRRYAALTPGCPIRAVTGFDCPGCGATRAVLSLARGDLGAALDHNLLVTLLLPVLVVVWVQWLLVTLGRRDAVWQPPPAVARTAVAVVAGWWVVRNLPGPFARLGAERMAADVPLVASLATLLIGGPG